MASAVSFENLLRLKDTSGRVLARSDGKHPFTILRSYDPYLASDVIASFTRGISSVETISTLYSDGLMVRGSVFGSQYDEIKDLVEHGLLPGVEFYNTTKTLLKINVTTPPDFPISVDRESGLVQVTGNVGGKSYKCTIDPLGVTLEVEATDGTTKTYSSRMSFAEFDALSIDQAQEQIINTELAQNALQATLDNAGKLIEHPTKISQINTQEIDVYFKELYTKDMAVGTPAPSYRIPPLDVHGNPTFDSNFTFLAIPTPDSTETNPQLYYLARNEKTGSLFVYNGSTFEAFKTFNYVTAAVGGGTDANLIQFSTNPHRRGARITHRYFEIPKNGRGELDSEFVSAVAGFVGGTHFSENPTAPKTSYRLSTGSLLTFQKVATGLVVTPVNTQVKTKTKTASIDLTGAPSRTSRTSGHGGPRKNPYQAQPLKKVKKVPKKLNEDLIRYGGGALGVFMMAMLLIPGIGPVLFAAGAALLVGSQILANNIYKFNDNPYNNAVTKFVNQLTKEQNNAETTAQKFWEKETELGNKRDAFAEMQRMIASPEFASDTLALASNLQGAMFEKLFNTTSGNKTEFNNFWSQSLEYRQAFLDDMRVAMADATKQDEFLSKYGIDAIRKADIFSLDYTVTVPDPSDPTKSISKVVSPAEALAAGVSVLEAYNDHERAIRELHNEVGDTIENCTGRALERIISQPGVDLKKFVEEHADDLARRFMYRTDITQTQIFEFLSKIPQESIDLIKTQMLEVQDALNQTNAIANRQKVFDDAYNDCIGATQSLLEIESDASFDETSLRTVAQTETDISTMIWAMSGEDVKRNAAEYGKIHEFDTDSLHDIYISKFASGTRPSPLIDATIFSTPRYRTDYDKFMDLLGVRKAVFTNPKVLEVLRNQFLATSGAHPLVSSAGMLPIDQDSLDATLGVLESDPVISADPSLLAQIQSARTLTVEREDLRKGITVGTVDRVMTQLSWGRYAKAPSTATEINAKIAELNANPKYAHFTTLDTATQRRLARLILEGEGVLKEATQDLHATESAAAQRSMVAKAKAELDYLIEGLASGTLAEKTVSEIEKEQWETDTPDKTTTRAQARDRLLAMDRLMEKYHIPPASRKDIALIADSIASGDGRSALEKEDLIKALYQNVKGITLSDCSQTAIEIDVKLEEIVTAEGLDITKPDDVRKLLTVLNSKREGRKARSREKLEPLKQKAGRKQVDYFYEETLTGKTKAPAKAVKSRREAKYEALRTQTNIFLDNVGKSIDNLKYTSTCTVGRVGTKTKSDMKKGIDDLRSSVKDALELSDHKIDALLKEAGGLTWDDLKTKIDRNNFTAKDFEEILKLIKKKMLEKNKTMARRLRRSRRRVNRRDSKKQNKGAEQQDIINGANRFVDAEADVATNRAAKAGRTDVNEFAPDAAKEVAQSEVSHKVEAE